MVSMALEIEKEESPIPLLVDARNVYRAPYGSPKLITVRIRFPGRRIEEIVSGIQRTVAHVVINIPMQLAAAGLGHHIDHVSSAPTVLRGERMLLDFEFLHIVRRRNVNDAAPSGTGIPRTVQQKGVRPEVATSKVEERDVLVGRALLSARRNGLSLRKIVDRRIQLDEIEHVPQIDRQFGDLLAGNLSADVGVVGLQ